MGTIFAVFSSQNVLIVLNSQNKLTQILVSVWFLNFSAWDCVENINKVFLPEA